MGKARSRGQLEQAIASAQTDAERGRAHFNLAIFHDNNCRETEAIPHYQEALRLGIEQELVVEALAWLASSLHKTGRSKEALERIEQSFALGPPTQLAQFLAGLRRRAWKSLEASNTDCARK